MSTPAADQLECRFVATDQPRALLGRHTDDCDGTLPRAADFRYWPRRNCRGCQPCTARHCLVCGIEHTDRVCAGCVNETRGELNRVVWLSLRLLSEREHHADADIPGGNATVLAGPYSLGAQAPDHTHESHADPLPPLLVLATWEDDWRQAFAHQAAGPAQIAPAAAYLLRHLHHAAAHHDAFDDFAREVRHLRQRLEDVLYDGDRDEPGVQCRRCKVALVRATDPRRAHRWCHGHGPQPTCPWPRAGCCDRGGLRDEWACPRCGKTYGRRDYHNLVTAEYRANAPAMTAADIADEYDVPRGSIRGWASVGKVRRRGHDLSGRVLYDVGDVCRHAGIGPDAGQTA